MVAGFAETAGAGGPTDHSVGHFGRHMVSGQTPRELSTVATMTGMPTSHQGPLLTTKLMRPPAPPEVVPRPRFLAQLDRSARGRITLITAAAGYGKTTLLSQWLAGRRGPVAWLSLDGPDDSPALLELSAAGPRGPHCRRSGRPVGAAQRTGRRDGRRGRADPAGKRGGPATAGLAAGSRRPTW